MAATSGQDYTHSILLPLSGRPQLTQRKSVVRSLTDIVLRQCCMTSIGLPINISKPTILRQLYFIYGYFHPAEVLLSFAHQAFTIQRK